MEGNMNKNEAGIDTAVYDYLSRHLHERREQFIANLMKEHPGERGFSKANINRRLTNMKNQHLILIEDDPDVLAQYGIREKGAKNASYVLPKSANEIAMHLNYVFASLRKEDKKKEVDADVIKTALRELKTYENNYIWSSSQLDDIVLNLDNEDAEVIDQLLKFLYNYMKKKILPENKDVFLVKLKKLLERYPDGLEEYKELRCYVIQLLGYYEDHAVIDQLRKDSKSGKLLDHVSEYCHRNTAKVIEKSRTELYLFEIELRKEGKTESADYLAFIRGQAKNMAEILAKQHT